jgi:urease accessory protein
VESAGSPSLGRGTLAFVRCGAKTVLREARATSPLKLLSPKNHGSAAWVFAATFGGGLVDGDAIAIDVEVGEGASALLGTQASTKVYRCPSSECRQDLRARVASGALLVSVPDPVACFAGARYAQSAHVELDAEASLVLVEAFTAGRSARGERWDFARCASRTLVRRGGAPLVLEALLLDPAHGDLRARMGRMDAIATVLLAGPRVRSLRDAALALAPPLARSAPLVAAASPIGDDAAIVRIAATTVEAATRAARERLAGLAGLLGDDPFARKW